MTLAVAASLLTFPNAIPWMIGFWLAWHTLVVARGQSGWLPLVTCVVILLVKRVAWLPGLVVLGGVVLSVAAFRVALYWKVGGAGPNWLPWGFVAMLWTAWGYMAVDWRAATHHSRRLELSATRPVACLGDSLTSGEMPGTGYPPVLQRLLTVPVVDLSQPGITTTEALKDLPRLIEANPQVVVIELGGHDYLKGLGAAATRENLEKLIAACDAIGAVVVLMEIPRGFVMDPFGGLERRIARASDLELIPDTAVRQLVLWSPYAPPGMWTHGPYLSNDGLHPNSRGNELLAGYVADSLARLFGPQIRRAATGPQP